MASIRRASTHFITRSICRECTRNFTRPAFTLQPVRTKVAQPTIRPFTSSIRHHSAPASQSKVYEYEQVRQLTESPSKERILIDVREPSEYAAGYIPTAINIPIKSQPDALFLPAHEFEDRFGFSKPEADQEVVFYCRSGVRSSAAANLAQQVGYKNVAEYRGSWLDWEKQGGIAGKG